MVVDGREIKAGMPTEQAREILWSYVPTDRDADGNEEWRFSDASEVVHRNFKVDRVKLGQRAKFNDADEWIVPPGDQTHSLRDTNYKAFYRERPKPVPRVRGKSKREHKKKRSQDDSPNRSNFGKQANRAGQTGNKELEHIEETEPRVAKWALPPFEYTYKFACTAAKHDQNSRLGLFEISISRKISKAEIRKLTSQAFKDFRTIGGDKIVGGHVNFKLADQPKRDYAASHFVPGQDDNKIGISTFNFKNVHSREIYK